jgi:hypothetical protein
MELRLSIDERDDLEDELEATVEGIPFIVHPDVTDTYGKVFSIAVNPENGQPKVSTPNGDAAASSCGN